MAAPKPASRISGSLKAYARTTEGYVGRLENLHRTGALSARDVTRTYEGAFLAFHTSLERHIERLFLALVMSRVAPSGPRPRNLVRITDHRVAHEVVTGDRPYVDWLPLAKTKRRASIYLSGGRPFDRLQPVDMQVFERMQIIRNAIAHQSHHAKRSFKKVLIDGQGLPPAEQSPAGYLRGSHTSGQSRLSYLMAQGVDTVDRLCA